MDVKVTMEGATFTWALFTGAHSVPPPPHFNEFIENVRKK